MSEQKLIYWFSEVGISDVGLVGGKNASLGEMYGNLSSKGVRIPNGFAVSAYAYDFFVESTGIKSQIHQILDGLDANDVNELAIRGKKIRDLINETTMPAELQSAIEAAYVALCQEYRVDIVDVAVRSSATAEDLPDASFAGQQDTYLNVRGVAHLQECCRACFASLFTNRAIAYRQEKGYDHFAVSLSIAVQKMVRSDLASAGVMFSLDTESGFLDTVYITGGYGLGENVVQGSINPDEWYVYKNTLEAGKKPIIYSLIGKKQQKMLYVEGGGTEDVPVSEEEANKFCLNDEEVLELARWSVIIEKHYSEEAGYHKPMDMEWAKDGQSEELFIVQARPETVVSRRDVGIVRRVTLQQKGQVIAEGMAVGDRIGHGKAAVINSAANISEFQEGMVLVTEQTDPDWVPIMHKASAIVTDRGGRTSHAAIISRELGIPCVVGTEDGSKKIQPGQDITVSCAGGSKGTIYEGLLPYSEEEIRLSELNMPSIPIWLQQEDPEQSFSDSRMPVEGVGLVRIGQLIQRLQAHPLACLNHPGSAASAIEQLSLGYSNKRDWFVSKLAEYISHIAAANAPKQVRVLLSDLPSSALDKLAGGSEYAYTENNPLLGLRGVNRYTDLDYEEAFELEMAALQKVREEMGLTNVAIILPAVRTAKELQQMTTLLSQHNLQRGSELAFHLMCHLPAQLIDLSVFADQCDGFVINVFELTQLLLGVDASNVLMRPLYDEKHPAVLKALENAMQQASQLNKPVGLSLVSPANMEFFASWPPLKQCSTLTVSSEVFMQTRNLLLEAEGKAL